ncbi:MAG: ORF6N domain-containing protein [Nitrospirota bacterium]
MGLPVPSEQVDQAIRLVRGHRVMFDIDLAELYGVDVKQLKRQVRRNRERFPHDFCFELSKEEQRNLRSQLGTLKRGEHSKYRSYAFTEQGLAMLSGVLRSRRAVQVNVAIMRAFVRLRAIIGSNKVLARRLAELEKKYDAQFRVVFDAIRELMEEPKQKSRRIGFKT